MSTPPSVPHNAGTAPSVPAGASTADDAAARAAAAVEQCCALLSGKDDTQKFTGLLLLTKHVPVPSTDTPEGAALRSRLLEAMGTKFLKRLLKMGARARKRAAATVGTASGATTAASGAGDDGPMYEGLALGVMALFCADKALAPGLAALLPLVLASIRSQDAVLQLGETPKLQAVRDAAACVSGILHAKCRIPSTASEVMVAVSGGLRVCLAAAMAESRAPADEPAQTSDGGDASMAGEPAAPTPATTTHSVAVQGCLEFLHCLSQVFRYGPDACAALPVAGGAILAACIGAPHPDVSEAAVVTFTQWQTALPRSADGRGKHRAAVLTARRHLQQVMGSSVSDRHRCACFSLIDTLLDREGKWWTVASLPPVPQAQRGGQSPPGSKQEEEGAGDGSAAPSMDAPKPLALGGGQFPVLLMRLVGIELKVAMDEATSLVVDPETAGGFKGTGEPLNPMPDPDEEMAAAEAAGQPKPIPSYLKRPPKTPSGSVRPPSRAKRAAQAATRMPQVNSTVAVCFNIVEAAVRALVSESGDGAGAEWAALPADALVAMKGALQDALSVTLDFLQHLGDSDLAPLILNRPGVKARPLNKAETASLPLRARQAWPMALACVRAVGSWGAEDFDSLQAEFCAALPAMLFLSPLPTARSTPPSPTSEPLCLILHALLQRSAEKEERAALVGCGGHWRLLSWMSRAALHAGDELVEVTVVGPSADLLALVASAAGVLLTILCVDNAIIAAQPAAKVKGKKGKKGKAKRRLVENGWLASIGALARACVKLAHNVRMAPSPSVAAQLKVAIPHLACLCGVVAREHTEAQLASSDSASIRRASRRTTPAPGAGAGAGTGAGPRGTTGVDQVETMTTPEVVAAALLAGLTQADASIDDGSLFTLLLQVTNECAAKHTAVVRMVREDYSTRDSLGRRVADLGDQTDATLLRSLQRLSL